MKKIIASFAALLMAGAAMASDFGPQPAPSPFTGQATTLGQQQQQSTRQTSTSQAENAGMGNGNTVVFEGTKVPTDTINRQVISGGTDSRSTEVIRNTPSMGAPNLTSSNDTCMGSASGAVSTAGFGLSLGKTYVDDNCVMLKNSRELWNMGLRKASLARLCMDSNNRDSIEMTGMDCPQTERDRAKAQAQATR